MPVFDELLTALQATQIPFEAYAWAVAPDATYGLLSLDGGAPPNLALQAHITPRHGPTWAPDAGTLADIPRGGADMARTITEASEIRRLTKLYKTLPANEFALAQGLIAQAARIRVNLDKLAADIEANGLTEWFQQSEKVDPYKKTRPEADLFVKLDKRDPKDPVRADR